SLVGWINGDRTVKSVQQHILPGFQLLAYVLKPNNCWNAQSSGHDCRVGSFAADIGCKAEDISLIQLRRIGRGQIMANNNARLAQMTEVYFGFKSQEIIEHA